MEYKTASSTTTVSSTLSLLAVDETDVTPYKIPSNYFATVDMLYPVGHIIITTNSNNPATYLGVGTWVAYATGRTLVGINTSDTDFDVVGETGGAKTHTLTEAQMPQHRHTFTMKANNVNTSGGYPYDGTSSSDTTVTGYTNYTGSSTAHNNLQPYIVVYMWNRTV